MYYGQGEGTNLNLHFFYTFLERNQNNSQIIIKNRPNSGKNTKEFEEFIKIYSILIFVKNTTEFEIIHRNSQEYRLKFKFTLIHRNLPEFEKF